MFLFFLLSIDKLDIFVDKRRILEEENKSFLVQIDPLFVTSEAKAIGEKGWKFKMPRKKVVFNGFRLWGLMYCYCVYWCWWMADRRQKAGSRWSVSRDGSWVAWQQLQLDTDPIKSLALWQRLFRKLNVLTTFRSSRILKLLIFQSDWEWAKNENRTLWVPFIHHLIKLL